MEDLAVAAETMAGVADSTVAAADSTAAADFMEVDFMVADSMHLVAAAGTGLPPDRVACVHFRGRLAAMRTSNQIDLPRSIPGKV
jgi:hypothetical protein